jgi:hypothetical protein
MMHMKWLFVILILCPSLFSQDLFNAGILSSIYFSPTAMASGDLNKDGITDVVVGGKNDLDGQGIISIFYGKGDGTFKNKIDVTADKYPVDIHIVDMDGDGFPDIVTCNSVAQTVTIFINQKSNFKLKDPIKIKGEPSAVGVGDFNKDGKLDLAVLVPATRELNIFKGGGFKLVATKVLDAAPMSMAVDDFADGGFANALIDYIDSSDVSIFGANENKNSKWEFSGVKINMRTHPQFGTLGDFDGDGFDDAAVLKRSSNEMQLVLAEANGLLLDKTVRFKIPAGATAFALGDFNKDKKTDIAVLDSANSQIAIYLNQNTAVPSSSSFVQARIALIYESDYTKENTADVGIIPSYKSVSMCLYDGNGKIIRKYFDFDKDLPEGQFSLEWNGTDENDAEVPNGQYAFYYKLGSIIATRSLKK